jgi:glycosyltransferase involved in cell wall biosynthesis
MDSKLLFDTYKCCVVIPTYNNQRTLRQVITEVLVYTNNVIVINDGSTDTTADILKDFGRSIEVVTHPKNLGKGKALRNSFQKAKELGYTHVITIDSDGQHFASDLPSFIQEVIKRPDTLVIGARNMEQAGIPGKSSFGNKFSNFWYWVETGIKLDDTQSGYRLYPIQALEKIRFVTNRFEFEIEVIVKAVWKGLKIKNIPVKIYYAPGDNRVSHFRPFADFSRISVLNTYLVTLAILYYIPLRFFKSLSRENIKSFFNTHLFNQEESASRKSYSIGFGVFMGIFPIWGYQMLIGVALAHLMKLNKALVLVAANISIPPFIPFIIYGSYKLGALLVSDPKNDILFSSGISLELVKENLIQYALGAVALSLVGGVLASILTYVTVKLSRPSDKY